MAASALTNRSGLAPRLPSAPLQRLAERLHDYLSRDRKTSPQEFFLDAVRHELERREGAPSTALAWPPRPTTEDVRLHAWLNGRLERLRQERRPWWQKALGVLLGRPVAAGLP